MTSEAEQFVAMIRGSLKDGTLRKAVLSKPVAKANDTVQRIDVRPVTVSGQELLQFTAHVGNQHQHRNLAAAEAADEICGLVGQQFRDCSYWTPSEVITARYTRKGNCTVRSANSDACSTSDVASHDRAKRRLIEDGTPVPFLVETGIMTAAGRVKSRHFSKFRQINRFVEFINDVIPHFPGDGVIRVVDFGCGKSYLTFAVHYLLTQLRSRDVRITGLDRRADVVGTCNEIVERLQLSNLEFLEGDIASYEPQEKIHLAVSLHACDTATDDALAVAAGWNTDVILAVPCCQHEMASTLVRGQQPVFSQHGILHERFSSLATDGLRALLMECAGYKTQVVEFIDTEHTPKNLLIQSIRRHQPPSESAQKERLAQLLQFSQGLQLPPLRLERKLKEYGLIAAASGE